MICFFPDPYIDEIFYSICARYSQIASLPSVRGVLRVLFNSPNVIATLEFQSHLENLSKSLPPGGIYTSDYFIDNHTLLPIFSPFLTKEREKRIRDDMKGTGGPNLHYRSGVMASTVKSFDWMRYCPSCVLEDRTNYDMTYWHRLPQVPGVFVCPTHGDHILNSEVPARNRRSRLTYTSAEGVIPDKVVNKQPLFYEECHDILLRISKSIFRLLENPHDPVGFEATRRFYLYRLYEVGLASSTGRLRSSELLGEFKTKYSKNLLTLLGCNLEDDVEENWLLRLIRNHRTSHHPLRHILLLDFLGSTLNDLYGDTPEIEKKLFGVGPWPCLNPCCEKYLQNCIDDIHVQKSGDNSEMQIGIFSCKCGFSYKKILPADNQEQKEAYYAISYGPLWESRLIDLWENPEISLRELARILNVDPRTINRQANRLGLSFPRPGGHRLEINPDDVLKEKIEVPPDANKYREGWLSLITGNPDKGTSYLRKISPGLYTWLYRNDADWFRTHKPVAKKTISIEERVDWQNRDIELSSLVLIEGNKLLSEPGKLIRVSISSIGRKLGCLALFQKHIDKLPLTKAALSEITEDQVAFGKRRLHWVVEQFKSENTFPNRWQMIKKAGIERLLIYQDIIDELDKAMDSFRT